MGKPTGFLEFPRRGPAYRPVEVRLRDWREVYVPQDDRELAEQGARCMDCGIPFCMQGCPLGNRIPDFNDGVYRAKWEQAADQLFATNNFPEFTGRLCPAPCESACVLGIGADPVTIERIEYEVAEHAFANGFAVSRPNGVDTGRRIAVVGSGPAGLAAAAQLRSVGHDVTVYERSDAIGGLLRYGIPEFKLEKAVLERRLAVMREAGIKFHANVTIGSGGTPLAVLQRNYDAVLLAIGSTSHGVPRGRQPGRARRHDVANRRKGPARRHPRRRGHGCGLPGHRPSTSCGVGRPDRDHGPSARRAIR
jgi:glutamate synthase (NADPH/NADH) small chain